jgi:hypothetical protein
VYPSRACTMQHGAHMHAGSDDASTSLYVQFRTSPAPRAATPAPRAPRGSTTRRRARVQPTPWQRLGVGPSSMLAARGAATCHPHRPSPSTRTRPGAVLQAIRCSALVRPLPLCCTSAGSCVAVEGSVECEHRCTSRFAAHASHADGSISDPSVRPRSILRGLPEGQGQCGWEVARRHG